MMITLEEETVVVDVNPINDDVESVLFIDTNDIVVKENGRLIEIYNTDARYQSALFDTETDTQATEWCSGQMEKIVFRNLDPQKVYSVRVSLESSLPDIHYIKVLPMLGQRDIAASPDFENGTGCGLIKVIPYEDYGYAILNDHSQPLTAAETAKWGVKVFDTLRNEIPRGADGYYVSPNRAEIVFRVPAGGIYVMGGRTSSGSPFIGKEAVAVPSVDNNYVTEYVIKEDKSGAYFRYVIEPACPNSYYMAAVGRTARRYKYRLKPGETKVYVPMPSFGGYHRVVAIPISLNDK